MSESIRLLAGPFTLPLSLLLDGDSDAVIDWLQKAQPVIIAGYPSLLHILAQTVLESSRALQVHPRCVFYVSESTADETRQLSERAFGVPVLSRYGAMEFASILAYTCPQGGWHVNAEGFIVEVVDRAFGNRAGSTSSRGRIVIADLRNYVMPFIRYEIGDVGWMRVSSQGKCTCGATVLPFGGIEGRASDDVVTSTGRRVPGIVLQRVMRVQADLFWEYQFRQEQPLELAVSVVPKRDYTLSHSAELAAHIEAFLNHELRVTVHAVDRIPKEPSGKRPVLKITGTLR